MQTSCSEVDSGNSNSIRDVGQDQRSGQNKNINKENNAMSRESRPKPKKNINKENNTMSFESRPKPKKKNINKENNTMSLESRPMIGQEVQLV